MRDWFRSRQVTFLKTGRGEKDSIGELEIKDNGIVATDPRYSFKGMVGL